jgi:hypothetical protein
VTPPPQRAQARSAGTAASTTSSALFNLRVNGAGSKPGVVRQSSVGGCLGSLLVGSFPWRGRACVVERGASARRVSAGRCAGRDRSPGQDNSSTCMLTPELAGAGSNRRWPLPAPPTSGQQRVAAPLPAVTRHRMLGGRPPPGQAACPLRRQFPAGSARRCDRRLPSLSASDCRVSHREDLAARPATRPD